MTSSEAKLILVRYRPGTPDAQEPEMVQALELVRQDPELSRWFDQHCAFQSAMRTKLRQIEVPAQLRAAILARKPNAEPPPNVIDLLPWWRSPVGLAAAAAVVLLLSVAAFWFRPALNNDGFANFQARMVSTVLRQYRMDIVTNDMAQVRQFLARQGAPADYRLTPGLEQLRLTGAGALQWRSHPVAMVCFNRGDNQMVYLFVLDRSAVKDPPPATPRLARVNELLTASWTRGDKTYVLAGPNEADFGRHYL